MRSFALVLALAACGSEPPARSPSQRAADSAPAIAALQASKFSEAGAAASRALELDPRASQAAAVRALANYQAAGTELVHSLRAIVEGAKGLEWFDHQKGRDAWRVFADRLASIDRDLAVVAADPTFSLELCLACWEHDWNFNGRVDDRDRKLFEIEYDGKGESLPDGDPRRRPTFRFDVGDAEWARAMLDFQRAAVEIILGYKWSELDKLFGRGEFSFHIKLLDKDRITTARKLILEGLGHAEKCRALYLAETDDDREWVPNPRQKSHPIPLDVDEGLYATWGAVLGDVHRLLDSEEGISIREMASVVDRRVAMFAPDAYIDFGKMLREPSDFTLAFEKVEKSPAGVEKMLRELLGNGYQTKMKPSPLIGRLQKMKSDLESGGDTIERKLRYLLWLN